MPKLFMAKERDYIAEILSVQSRNRDEVYFHSIIMRMENLERLFSEIENLNGEILKYFPIGLIACIEGYSRAIIKRLIDFGSPFLDNVSDLKKIQIDFEIVKAVHQKTITLGDFIAHLLPINNLSDINSHLSILTKKDYLNDLKTVYDRFEVEVLNKEKVMIIENSDEVYDGVKKTFKLRHIFAHEIADNYEIKSDDIALCFKSIKLLIKATSEFISEILYPNAPLTQIAITQSSIDDFDNVSSKIKLLEIEIETLLQEDDLKKFKKAQEWWDESRNMDSEFLADIGGKDGSIWKTLYFSESSNITNKRIDFLKETLKFINNQY